MTAPIRRLLITGAAGGLGRELRRRLAGGYASIRLSDVAEMAPAGAGEEVVRCDLGDHEAVGALCRDVDAIVHLGGRSIEGDWPTVFRANFQGAVNLWEAARFGGAKRVLFASSNHAIGMYRRSQRIDHTAPARPDSRYGLSKAVGEDIAAYYAWKHGVAGFCMRIGSCFAKPINARMLSTWQSYADFERMIRVGLTADYVYEIVYGMSKNTRGWWDNSNAFRLGYAPQDDSEVFAAEVGHIISTDPLEEERQGGAFVSPDFTGDPAKLP